MSDRELGDLPLVDEEFESEAIAVEIGRINYPPVARTNPSDKGYPGGWVKEYEALSDEERAIRYQLQRMDPEAQRAYIVWCIKNRQPTVSRESLEAYKRDYAK